MDDKLAKLYREIEYQRILDEARRKAQDQNRPTFAGNVLHGATLGYMGDAPEGWGGHLGSMLGSLVPYAAIGAATGGLVNPITARLGLQTANAAGVMAASPVAQALIHGGLTGGIAGAARQADTFGERLQNTALEGTLAAVIPAGISKLWGKKGNVDYNVNPKPEAPPEDWMKLKGRTEPIPGTTDVFSEADRFYPRGSYTPLTGRGVQNELPGMASYSPRDMRSEADMLSQLSKGDPIATSGNVEVTKFPIRKMTDVVKSQEPLLDAKGNPLRKVNMRIDPAGTEYVTAKATGEITDAFNSEVEKKLSGDLLRKGMFKKASEIPENLAALKPTKPGQADLPFPGEPLADFGTLATRKGYDIHTGEDGVLTLIGKGGKVERFTSLDDATGYLMLQKPSPQLPSELYGTMDKMINGPTSGKWGTGVDGRPKYTWTKMDDNALRLQKMMNQWVDTPIGNDIAKGLRPLTERMRINTLTGIKSADEAQATAKLLEAKGYQAQPLVFGDSIEVAYFKPGDPGALEAFKWYNVLRGEGIKGLGSNSGETLRIIGGQFGKTPAETEAYAWQLISQSDLSTRNTFLAGLFETPQRARSPLLQEVSWKAMKAAQGKEVQSLWAHDNFFEKLLKPLNKSELKTFVEVAEGRVAPEDVSLKIRDAFNSWVAIRDDIATRLDISPIKNYFTHKTDFDALWAVTKKSLLDPTQTEMWQKQLGEDGVNALKKLRMQAVEFNNTNWTKIPMEARKAILDQTQRGWNVTKWDQLPPHLRNNLPEEIFNQHLIPRVKDSKIPWSQDVRGVLESYVDTALRDIHFSPLLKEIAPVINKMPGAGAPGTERTVIEEFVSRLVSGTPNAYTTMLNNVTSETARSLGLPFMDPGALSKMITLYRGREYGGLITISTAMKHLNKVINVMAENGKYTASAMQKLPHEILNQARGIEGAMPNIPGVMGKVLPIEEAVMRTRGTGILDRAIRISNTINAYMFTPMQMVESGLRHLSANAAFDEGLKKGLDFKSALRLSMGRASAVMPELSITEAQMSAMRNVLKTDFGYDVAHMPALWSNPLARISTIFMSYPTKELEFLSKGISNSLNGYFSVGQTAGTAMAMESFEGAKLFRYAMASGLLFSLPSLFAKYLGIDASRFFGEHMFQFALPFYQRIGNMYNSIAGDDPITREHAKSAFVESVNSLVVPQYRQGKMFNDAVRSYQRGYTTDQAGHRIADSSFMGELGRVLGLPPQSYNEPKYVAAEWKKIAHEYNRERTYATSEFIRTGQMDEVQRWESKWGKKIESKDLAHAVEISNMPPEKRAQVGMAFDTIKQQLEQKPWLVGGM
jgi:hypothetical protein